MLLTVAHLIALDGLATGEAAVKAIYVLKEDKERYCIYRELELQRLVLLKPPRSYQLTQAGREALSLLKAMREAGLYPSLDRLKHKWRFLGSDILAALRIASPKNGSSSFLMNRLVIRAGQ